jgi:hypothetical protein
MARRARDATQTAEKVNGDVRAVMGHLTQALASDRDHQALVKAASFAAQADDWASSAIAAAREATSAAHSGDPGQLDKAADEAQIRAADARISIEHAMHLIPTVLPTSSA